MFEGHSVNIIDASSVETLKNCAQLDVACIGEGEMTMLDLVKAVKRKSTCEKDAFHSSFKLSNLLFAKHCKAFAGGFLETISSAAKADHGKRGLFSFLQTSLLETSTRFRF